MDYDPIADSFAPKSDRSPSNAYYERPATIRLLPELAGLDVLDHGCGAGHWCEFALRHGARVVGFDPSGEMIRHARERVGEGVELHACETAALAEHIGDRSFDLIISSLVMHYVDDLATEFRLLANHLRPGGRMVVSMKHPFIHLKVIKKLGYRATSIVGRDFGFARVNQIQRPLGVTTAAIHQAGLLIEQMEEAHPLPKMEDIAPHTYQEAMLCPFFLHMVLVKRGNSAG